MQRSIRSDIIIEEMAVLEEQMFYRFGVALSQKHHSRYQFAT